MVQPNLDINSNGIASIAIGKKILIGSDFLPIKDLKGKRNYDFPVDESEIYFLKQDILKNSVSFDGVYDLFVTLNNSGGIKAINIFLNFKKQEIIQLMNDKLGHYKLRSTSGLPGYSQTESYMWVSDVDIRFSLEFHKYLERPETQISLLIYSNGEEYPGELIIIEQRNN